MATVQPRTAKFSEQAPAYHGIKNAQYAIRAADGKPGGEVKKFDYAKSISFEPAIEQQPVYSNNQKVLALVSDQGYTGAIGTTAQHREFEEAIGQIAAVDNGLADVSVDSFVRFDYYYEYIEHSKNGIPYVVKVWALNLEASKATKENSTDTNTATLGEYSYPITVYGDKILDANGTEIYKDANGNEKIATRIISVPGDAGYTDFEKTVPTVKMPTAESGGSDTPVE